LVVLKRIDAAVRGQQYWSEEIEVNPLNVKFNPICHLLALIRAHHILHVSRIRVNAALDLLGT